MKTIPTLYTDYHQLLLDIEILGTIVSAPQQSMQEMQESLFEEFKRVHPFPTLEDERYKLSRQVSKSYQIAYNKELELMENESLMDFSKKPDAVETQQASFDFDKPIAPSMQVLFSYDARCTKSTREQIIEKYNLYTGDIFEQGITQTENTFNSVVKNSSLDLTDEQVENLGRSMEVDHGVEVSDATFEDADIDNTDYSSYGSDDEDEWEDEDSEYEDDYVDYEDEDDYYDDEDDYDDENEDESLDDEDDYEEEDFEDEYDDENDYSEDEYDEDDLLEDEDDSSEDEDEYGDEESDIEYESDANDDYEEDEYEDEPVIEEITKEPIDITSSISDTSKPELVQVNVDLSDIDTIQDDDLFDAESCEPVVEQPKSVVKETSQEKTTFRQIMSSESTVTITRGDEPTDLRQFIRKHPRCSIEFARQYFSKKQIEDAIRIGRVVKKGNILKL